jgi:hypothetical protein
LESATVVAAADARLTGRNQKTIPPDDELPAGNFLIGPRGVRTRPFWLDVTGVEPGQEPAGMPRLLKTRAMKFSDGCERTSGIDRYCAALADRSTLEW